MTTIRLQSLLHHICLITLPIILAIGSITLIPWAAQASPPTIHYQNPSGSTQLSMDNSNPAQPGTMKYQTKLPTETWSGEITPTKTVEHNGTVTIYGTFQDSPGNNLNNQTFCTGDVIATQHLETDRSQLDVSWTVTGGKDCTEIGQQFEHKLSEVLPLAN